MNATSKTEERGDQLGAVLDQLYDAVVDGSVLGLRHRLCNTALAQSAALQAQECIETGVLVVDASCRVLYANRAAEQVLRAARDICVQGQRLRVDDPGLGSRLARLVREARDTAGGKTHLWGTALAALVTRSVAGIAADRQALGIH